MPSDSKKKQPALFTIVSNNYLHFARTMLQSAKRHHPECKLYCVVVDGDLAHANALHLEFESIASDKLRLPLDHEFLFQYDILEANTAVKPWAMEYLLNLGHEIAIYVDPDIVFYAPALEVWTMLSEGADVVLTPHLLSPIADDKTPSELDIVRTGAFNLGFCAIRDSANTRLFLTWWQQKLERGCVIDLERGYFVDQKWLDLVPGLFENVEILRDEGYNVAYWNVAQRQLARNASGTFLVNGSNLVFFHFSGFNPNVPETFSKYQDRISLSDFPVLDELTRQYAATLNSNGSTFYETLEYNYGRFDDGETVPNIFRKLYRESHELRRRMGNQPFKSSSIMCEPWNIAESTGISPTNAMIALWHARTDLQRVLPIDSPAMVHRFYNWFVTNPTPADHFSSETIKAHERIAFTLNETYDIPAPRNTVMGLFQPESDAATHGVWASARLDVLVPIASGTPIRVKGLYFPESISRQSGVGVSALSFHIGDTLVQTILLKASGEFDVEFCVPESPLIHQGKLRILCDKFFVPKEIGTNSDERKLSWRLKALSFGENSVFDCTRLGVDSCGA